MKELAKTGLGILAAIAVVGAVGVGLLKLVGGKKTSSETSAPPDPPFSQDESKPVDKPKLTQEEIEYILGKRGANSKRPEKHPENVAHRAAKERYLAGQEAFWADLEHPFIK